MASPEQTVPPRHRLKANARQFWHRVTEGLEVNQLWSQFEKDARSSYRFYSYGLDQAEGHSWFHRAWAITKKLFWAILEKLSPARRVLLLIALVLMFFPAGGFTFADRGGEIHVVEFDLRFWGGLLLLALLLLELADRVVMKRDLEIAKDIQSWLLPGAPLQIPGYQIAYVTRPANTVAGDYYDVILRPGASARRRARAVRGGRRRGQEHPRRHADGHLPGQPADDLQQQRFPARTGGGREPLCLQQQPGRSALYHRLLRRTGSRDRQACSSQRWAQCAHAATEFGCRWSGLRLEGCRWGSLPRSSIRRARQR